LTGADVAAGKALLVSGEDHFARVVLEGILKAKVSLAIATADFKALLVPVKGGGRARSIVSHLRGLAREGVEIRILHSGVPSGPALRELRRELPRRLTIRRCPRLHAKAVVVDCARMYLGSANLTGAGLGAKGAARRNFELGVWTESAALIEGVLETFDGVWEGRHCAKCGRGRVCPVPLEEPALS